MAQLADPISLPHAIITRAPGLLPMLYRISELAEELKVPVKLVKRPVNRRVAHQKDTCRHVWSCRGGSAKWDSRFDCVTEALDAAWEEPWTAFEHPL